MSVTEQYLRSIEVSTVIHSRVLEIERFYKNLLGNVEPSHTFLSESIDGQGQKIFENLNFVFADKWCEAQLFQTSSSFDLVKVPRVVRLVYKMENYDGYAPITGESKITVEANLEYNLSIVLKATGSNCGPLWNLTKDYLVARAV